LLATGASATKHGVPVFIPPSEFQDFKPAKRLPDKIKRLHFSFFNPSKASPDERGPVDLWEER
jgi:hypothetical protein